MALLDQLFISSVWTNSAVRAANTSGTVLVSAAASDDGEAIADAYTLTLSAVSGGTGTVTVNATAPNNPFKGRVVTGVALDGTTIVKNVIPGINLIFSASGANTNTAAVNVGSYLGSFDAFGGGAGVPSTGVQHRVLNNGTGAVSGAKAVLTTQSVMVKKVGSIFSFVKPFAAGATEKATSGQVQPYRMTVANVTGSGPTKVADLKVDTVTLGAASILDLNAGTTISGSALKAVAGQSYRILTGPLTDVEFALDPAVAGSDTANILIFPSRYVQIAPDASGSAGTYGTADVDLTETGQATGVITPSGVAFYWVRILVPSGAISNSNPYLSNVEITASESGAADFLS